jgi:hypothetical protein
MALCDQGGFQEQLVTIAQQHDPLGEDPSDLLSTILGDLDSAIDRNRRGRKTLKSAFDQLAS